ncbi:hypothetical protein G7L40_20245 [Paenibacillus polymyxa]|uniref:Uncharacterized protein n=1 Tax=Paenibacillus polymyxa TaxID=1406 RepID=A0A378Y164_PAEPO|nr:hypothetical protein [Paenibacillus polymyxa]MBE7896179.1 hypothetical protein [Paenibacillus polymyxa]MBG9765878.1 hypothetical protein [Paenibacillus polymyxa]MCC3256709.1 hypothetical protein [Paenibacillus polymyxa]QPK54803.1 hypothetical protein G7035_20285 [Paenibacillus polymyxa]QPK59894.1 hypothetical protein G7L40_20245 [Paenibacillus polymyxa]
METAKYIIFSMLDGMAIFIFGFGMYSVKIRDYWIQFIVSSLCISVGSYLYMEYGFPNRIAPVTNLICMILFLVILFKLSPLSSLRISGISFLVQMILQTLTAVILALTLKIDFFTTTKDYGTLIQFLGDSTMILISLALRKRSVFFTTLPYQYTLKFKINVSNVVLFIISLIGVSVMTKPTFDNMTISVVFWIIIFVLLIFIERRKEIKNEYD